MPAVAASADSSSWLALMAASAGLLGLVSALLLGVCCCWRSRGGHKKAEESRADDDTTDEESARPTLLRPKESESRSRGRVAEEDEEEEEEEHVYEDVEQGKKKKTSWFSRRDSSKQKELSQQDLASLTVKERISQLEQGKQDDGRVSKPKKKRPSNQAFQEFERSGMLISFQGQVPKRQLDGDMQAEDGEEVEEDFQEEFHLPIQMHPEQEEAALIQQQQTVKQEDLAAVTRETELLKSFRKPPPPKNRGRAKRSGHSQVHSDNLQSPTRGLESPLETEEETISSIKTSPSREITDFSSTDSGIDNTQSSCSHSLPDFLSKHDDLGPLNKTRSVEDCGGSEEEETAPQRRLSGILSDSRNLLCAPQVSARLVKDFMQDDEDCDSKPSFNVISIHLNPLGSESEASGSPGAVSIPGNSPRSKQSDERALSKSAPNGNTEDLIKKFSYLSHSPPSGVTYVPDTNSKHEKTRRRSHDENLRSSKSHRSRHPHKASGRVHDAMVKFNDHQEPTHV